MEGKPGDEAAGEMLGPRKDAETDAMSSIHTSPSFSKSKVSGLEVNTAEVNAPEEEEEEEEEEKEEERFTYWPYGFQQRAEYEHSKKHPDMMGVTYNGRMRQFVLLDSKGITTWSKDAIEHTVQRAMSYPKYEYRLITSLIYVRKYNVYFILSKDFSVKVFNRDFDETCRVSADLRSVLFMLFNPIRDELITGGVGGTKVWRYHQVANKTWKEIKPMANYILTLKYELKNVGGSWVKKVELDLKQQHLYCCSDTDLHAYDMDGNSLFKYERAHAMSITGCAYSLRARNIVTASADTEVKVWSITGGLVHTFRGHSQPVTNLVLHPEDSALILTSSLDGTVRVWSLEILEPVYSMQVSEEGIRWMGFTDDNHLYMSTARHLTVWALNTTITFWALARCHINHLSLAPGHDGKSTRIVAVGDDSSVRILSRVNRSTVSMVMPPPPISPLTHIHGVTHVRDVNITYVLLTARYLWLYTNKSDPACRLAVWDLLEIQTKLIEEMQTRGQQLTREQEQEKRPSSVVSGAKVSSHRATVDGLGNEVASECRCICFLNSPATAWTDEGPCCPLQQKYLLLGLEDGRILFMDPVIRGKKYMEFRANKDAISFMKHDERHATLVTRCDVGDACLLQLWSLPDLDLQYEVYSPPDVTVFSRLDTVLLTGHTDGAILRHELVPIEPESNNTKPKSLRQGIVATFANSEKSGHRKTVTSLDVSYSLRTFLSASPDGSVKLWNEAKVQVAEIQLEESLTSACFLNDLGDVIVALNNHLFFIDRSKVSRQALPSADDEDDGEESDQFEDVSMLTELGEAVDPINMRTYLVPYKNELLKEVSEGGPYVGVNASMDKQQDMVGEEVMEEAEPPAPSEIYDSPRSSHHDLALIDLTLTQEVTEYDIMGEEAFKSENSPAAKIVPKRMTPKERRRAMKKSNRVVTFGPPKMDPNLGVEIPQCGGSPNSTPRPASSSSSSSSFFGSESDCSWLSFSSGGRSTPSDLSWYSEEDEETEREDEGMAEDGGEAKTSPKPTTTKPEVDKKQTEEERPARVRRKKIFDDIKIDSHELLKEEAARRRREKRRARKQADQAVRDVGQQDEKQVVNKAMSGEPVPPAPPARKVREIKKKEKREARRVGQSKDQPVGPHEDKPEEKDQPDGDAPQQDQPDETAKLEEERRREQEEAEQRAEEEERKRREEEEAKKQREEEEDKRKEEEEQRRAEEEAKKEKEKEEEEKRKDAAIKAAKQSLLEKDKERQKISSAKSKTGKEQGSIQPSSTSRSAPRKRVASAPKTRSSKLRTPGSTVTRRPKPVTSSPSKPTVSPPGGEGSIQAEVILHQVELPETRDQVETDEENKGKKSVTIEIPRVGSALTSTTDGKTAPTEDEAGGTPSETHRKSSPEESLPSILGATGRPIPPPLTLDNDPDFKLPLPSDSLSTSGLPSTTGFPSTPGSPTVTSITGLSEYPSLITPPLSPSHLSTFSSRPPSCFSRPNTLYSGVSKKPKTVTFSPPASPNHTGVPLLSGLHDVQSWLASAPDADAGTESIADTRSLLGDPHTQEESRSRSPEVWSYGESEMTVPQVDLPLSSKGDEDDDWWWRKSRRRRSVPTTRQATPAEQLKKRPHTAHVLMEKLTPKELETYYKQALLKYQDMIGAPEAEKLYQNEGNKFEGNWQDRAIERHLLLKMQRQLRAQSANDKAHRLLREQQERMKEKIEKKMAEHRMTSPELAFHLFHVQKSNRPITHRPPTTPYPSTTTRTPSATSSHRPVLVGGAHSVPGGRGRRSRMSSAQSKKTRPATAGGRMQATPAPSDTLSEKAGQGAERPFRCRLGAPPANSKPRPQSMMREEIDIRLLDPRNPESGLYRPRTGVSVPSKCSRYVLIEGSRLGHGEGKVVPTIMEQKLIAERFPEHQDEWTGHMKPLPKFRPPLLLYHPHTFTQHSVT